MDNYVYIVAGLPELTSGFENTGFDYAAVKESIVELLSEKDQQLVELMEEGFDENTLGADFYAKAAESKNRFIREYFDFDGRLRNMKVNYLAKRLGKNGENFMVELPEADFDEEKQIQDILADAVRTGRQTAPDKIGRGGGALGEPLSPHGGLESLAVLLLSPQPALSRRGPQSGRLHSQDDTETVETVTVLIGEETAVRD